MYAYRINIFHIADRNHVACAVAHYLVLDLLPACDAALYQNLSHAGKAKAIFKDLGALLRVVGNTAARAAQGVGRTEHHRITDPCSDLKSCLYVLYDVRWSHRLADFFHGFLKHLTVLSLFDGQGCSSDQAHIMFFKETCILKLHGKIQSCLAAQGRKNTVRLFL